MTPLSALPNCTLHNVTVPATLLSDYEATPQTGPAQNGLMRTTLGWADGTFCAPSALPSLPQIDASGMTALPLFTEPHVHLDKTHTIAQTGFADGTLMGAITLVSRHMAQCSYDDILTRMTRAAEEACARGVRHLRTHIDAPAPLDSLPAWHAAQQLQSAMAPRLSVQIATLSAITRAQEDGFDTHCAQIAQAGGVLGAFIPPTPVSPALLDTFLQRASHHGLDVDFHIDETLDSRVCNIATLAQSIQRTGFSGRVVAGHCCALAALPTDARDAALDLIAASGMHVITLPQTNLYLQDRRAGATPTLRGLTLIHELRSRGVPVSIGTDNVRDAFFPFGEYDPLGLLANHVAAGHLDTDLGGWMRAITDIPAQAMGIEGAGRIAPNQPADLMVLPCSNWPDILATKPEHRRIIRAGIMDATAHTAQAGAPL